KECKEIIKKIGICQTGNAVITSGGNLPAKYVIHTVGPVWNDGNRNEAEKLAACYINSLRLAVEHKIKTISFPNISTGIYGYPKKEAAEIALKTVCKFLEMDMSVEKLIFVCFDRDNFNLYQSWVKSNFEKLQE
ncbi:MAG TPA: macro domain-containing protein, partial [Chitinophagaceae bacterium]|nr:macro domain-containing protein [Chitinophagaceae bacterium]